VTGCSQTLLECGLNTWNVSRRPTILIPHKPRQRTLYQFVSQVHTTNGSPVQFSKEIRPAARGIHRCSLWWAGSESAVLLLGYVKRAKYLRSWELFKKGWQKKNIMVICESASEWVGGRRSHDQNFISVGAATPFFRMIGSVSHLGCRGISIKHQRY